ncbi:hypothetical protein NXV44_00065 [Bacteroides thetaiotaomicron]|nr:hypothetical protein [Bacteroides thetaiotaomicron]
MRTKSLSNSDNGNSWAMNNNCLDARTFNIAQYLVLVSTAHFPQWGGSVFIYVRCNLGRIVHWYGIYFRCFDIQSFFLRSVLQMV